MAPQRLTGESCSGNLAQDWREVLRWGSAFGAHPPPTGTEAFVGGGERRRPNPTPRRRYFFPPKMLPNTPRAISRPTELPMLRITDLAKLSTRPSCRPPRGPVDPNRTSERPPKVAPPGAAAPAVPPVPPAAPTCAASAARPLSFS